MTSSPERFSIAIRVQPADIDELGHVNNLVYLRWVQEVAIAHWTARTTPEQRAALTWVVVRHEIDYKRPAMPDDELTVTTWVGVASRRTYERHTEIARTSDTALLAKARTLWVPLDPTTMKVAEVSAEVRERFSVPPAEPT
jgi:acyl-CoA thioester hydrolase